MTNHLARGNADLRTQQAIGMREWARDQSVAVVNIGDFNMDFDFRSQKGNDAFVELLRDNVWQWVRPVELIDTNWSDPDGDGNDNYPDSMLDFAFAAAQIIWPEGAAFVSVYLTENSPPAARGKPAVWHYF